MTPYYDDGTCVIYHGDCREILPSLAFDAIITDPPYGIAWESAQYGNPTAQFGKPIANDRDTSARDDVIVANADMPILCFGSWRAAFPPELRHVLVFEKDCFHAGLIGNQLQWLKNWEPIFVCGKWPKATPTRSAIVRTREVAAAGYSGYTTRAGHPHAKPLDVMRELLDCTPGALICDPFLGSGSTLRAAKDRHRRAIGIEIEERYCEIAARRLAQEVLPFT